MDLTAGNVEALLALGKGKEISSLFQGFETGPAKDVLFLRSIAELRVEGRCVGNGVGTCL